MGSYTQQQQDYLLAPVLKCSQGEQVNSGPLTNQIVHVDDVITNCNPTPTEPVDGAVPKVMVKFHWVQLELLDPRLERMLSPFFNVLIILLSCGVGSGGTHVKPNFSVTHF